MLSRAKRGLALWLLACAPLGGEIRSLTILHTNDLHARLMPLDNRHGGFAYLATVIRRERAHCADCILLNAGDVAQGTPVSTIFHGLPVFEIANLLGFDASTLGNHDFDYGWPQARKFIAIANYPMVSSNVVGSSGQLFAPKPYVVLNVNGLRVAVIGAMTDELKTLTLPKLMGEWHTVPVLQTVRKYAAELKSKSDLIVLLGHISPAEERQFLTEAPEIPVLVTGHAHSGLPQAVTQDGRIMVRVKGYSEELGRLELKVDTEKKAPVSWKWRHIVVDPATAPPNAEVARLVKHWEDEVTAEVDQPLAATKKPLGKPAVKAIIEQAMRDQTGADFAYMNLSGVRDVLPEGPILVRNLWNIM